MRSWGHRSRARQSGFSADDMAGKPIIAILNTWSDANPCHAHFRLRADEVKRGVWQAGGFPMEIPLMTLGETFMKPTTMLYRNLLAMEAEEALRAYPADGAVLLGGCDKTVPALLMGATSANLPSDLRPGRTDAARQLARADSGIRKRRVEVLGRAPRRHARRVHVARDGRGDRPLLRHVHDDGHGLDDGGGGRSAGHDAARRVVDTGARLGAFPHGRRLRPAHRRDGLGGSEAARHPDDRSVRECRHRGDGARRIDQRHHPPDCDGGACRSDAGSRPVRRAVAPDAVHRATSARRESS